MRQYPKVRIGREQWTVRVVKKAMVAGEQHAGYCDHDRRLIAVGQHRQKREMASTLLHELTHAVSRKYGAKLREEQVLAVEQGLCDIVVDNLPLLKRLCKELK